MYAQVAWWTHQQNVNGLDCIFGNEELVAQLGADAFCSVVALSLLNLEQAGRSLEGIPAL